MKILLQTIDDEDWYWKHLEDIPDECKVLFPTQKLVLNSDIKEMDKKYKLKGVIK